MYSNPPSSYAGDQATADDPVEGNLLGLSNACSALNCVFEFAPTEETPT